MQLMPLQNLNVVFLEIEAAREHACDIFITLNTARFAEQFDHTPIFAVLDGILRLRDKVGVIFNAHGNGA